MESKYLKRFLERIEINSDGCWIWSHTITHERYAVFWDGKQTMAHRTSFEHWKGEIKEGLQIDHLCRNRSCVNPEHLEAVSHAENMKRISVHVRN